MSALVGMYFIGFHNGVLRSGIVEAAIDPTMYLVRFDGLANRTDDSPVSLAVVSIEVMGGTCRHEHEEEPPPWSFFISDEERYRYWKKWWKEPTEEAVDRARLRLKPTVN
jgi:hypothetical protein